MKQSSQQTRGVLNEAVQHQQAGRLNEAESLLKKLSQAEPDNSEVFYRLSHIAAAKKQWSIAQYYIEEALSLTPTNPQYYRGIADIFWQTGYQQKAISACQTAIYNDPFCGESYKKLASFYEKQGDLYGAIKAYQEALHLNNRDTTTQLALSRCLFDAGFLDESLEQAKLAYEQQPYAADVVSHYALVLVTSGYSQDGMTVLRHGLDLYPNNATLHYYSGLANFRLDKYEDALLSYERSLSLRPNVRDTLIDYAICLRTIGDELSAEHVLAKVGSLSK
jgi:tetratricopeptide (TPR) repeat protein